MDMDRNGVGLSGGAKAWEGRVEGGSPGDPMPPGGVSSENRTHRTGWRGCGRDAPDVTARSTIGDVGGGGEVALIIEPGTQGLPNSRGRSRSWVLPTRLRCRTGVAGGMTGETRRATEEGT